MHSLQGLRDLGYVESKNLVSESRSAEGRAERLPELAAELVRLHVDIIVAYGIQATRAAKHATQTIPIVMVGFGGDPVEAGLVESLARPGGNMTGLTSLGVELSSKRLELLKEVVPSLSHVAVLWDAGRPFARQSAAFETAAHELGSNYGSWRCVVLTIWTAPSRRRPGKAFKR